MMKQEARIYFVLDSKTETPRLRIEDGMVYPDGVWRSWCELEYLPPEIFFKLCAEWWMNRP